MNREEFLLIREELTSVVLEYEVIQKKISFYRNSYLLEFSAELEQELYLNYENDYMLSAIKKKADNEPLANIKKRLEEYKVEFSNHIESFKNKVALAKDMNARCSKYNANDMAQLDKEYLEYCKLYHPVIKAHSTEGERALYNALSVVYRLGNITGFKNLMNENKDILTSTNVNEDEYEIISVFYKESIRNLKNLIDKAKTEFPLNVENIFLDENALTNEYANIRDKNYALREMNKNLHKDFILNFEFDFILD